MLHKAKPILHKRIFWDVDFEKINYDTKQILLLNGFLNPAMWMICAIAAANTAMKKFRKLY
jgi:hypothetical protein